MSHLMSMIMLLVDIYCALDVTSCHNCKSLQRLKDTQDSKKVSFVCCSVSPPSFHYQVFREKAGNSRTADNCWMRRNGLAEVPRLLHVAWPI